MFHVKSWERGGQRGGSVAATVTVHQLKLNKLQMFWYDLCSSFGLSSWNLFLYPVSFVNGTRHDDSEGYCCIWPLFPSSSFPVQCFFYPYMPSMDLNWFVSHSFLSASLLLLFLLLFCTLCCFPIWNSGVEPVPSMTSFLSPWVIFPPSHLMLYFSSVK